MMCLDISKLILPCVKTSHVVATACSLGLQPQDQTVTRLIPFFPTEIAAKGGDLGGKEGKLVQPATTWG